MAERSPDQLVEDALKGFVDERRQHLIIESGPYYVQFAAIYPDGVAREPEDARRPFWEMYAQYGLYAEAVSDEYLSPNVRLGTDGAARLERLGWVPPAEIRNWTRVFELRSPTDCAVIAGDVVETFVDGFEVDEPLTFDVGDRIEI